MTALRHGHAERRPQKHLLGTGRQHHGCKRLAQAFRYIPGGGMIGLRQQNGEFLAADPGKQIHFTQHPPANDRQRLERLVADRVTVAVVDRFEMIGVQQQ